MVRLGRMLASGGAATEPAAVLKVLRMLSESRVFHLGGILVGILAFRAYANVFGVRFDKAALQTQDVDIAHDRAIGVALRCDRLTRSFVSASSKSSVRSRSPLGAPATGPQTTVFENRRFCRRLRDRIGTLEYPERQRQSRHPSVHPE
jgi:hypothetical protein